MLYSTTRAMVKCVKSGHGIFYFKQVSNVSLDCVGQSVLDIHGNKIVCKVPWELV